jgi:hypothetical protein
MLAQENMRPKKENKMKKIAALFLISMIVMVMGTSCKKSEDIDTENGITGLPVIQYLSADNQEIVSGEMGVITYGVIDAERIEIRLNGEMIKSGPVDREVYSSFASQIFETTEYTVTAYNRNGSTESMIIIKVLGSR